MAAVKQIRIKSPNPLLYLYIRELSFILLINMANSIVICQVHGSRTPSWATSHVHINTYDEQIIKLPFLTLQHSRLNQINRANNLSLSIEPPTPIHWALGLLSVHSKWVAKRVKLLTPLESPDNTPFKKLTILIIIKITLLRTFYTPHLSLDDAILQFCHCSEVKMIETY